MAVTSLEEGLETRTEELRLLWNAYRPRVLFTDPRRTKIENYFDEIPARIRMRQGYEALFGLTRIATMLGEIRIEYKDLPVVEEPNGTNQGSTENNPPEEIDSNVQPIK